VASCVVIRSCRWGAQMADDDSAVKRELLLREYDLVRREIETRMNNRFAMLAVFIATRLYGTPQNSSYVIGLLVTSILIFTIGYLRYGSTPGHPALQVFGGFLLGMLSIYIKIVLISPQAT